LALAAFAEKTQGTERCVDLIVIIPNCRFLTPAGNCRLTHYSRTERTSPAFMAQARKSLSRLAHGLIHQKIDASLPPIHTCLVSCTQDDCGSYSLFGGFQQCETSCIEGYTALQIVVGNAQSSKSLRFRNTCIEIGSCYGRCIEAENANPIRRRYLW
jgi:hypothetical protein